MSTALGAAALLAVFLFGISAVPFSAVLATIAAFFVFRTHRKPWPEIDA